MNNKTYYLILYFIVVPVIIYLYFLKWKTNTFYGDEILFYRGTAAAKNYFGVIDFSISLGKFRPIHAISSEIILKLFHKDLYEYYVFNAFVQAVNVYLLSLLLNLFLRAPVLSLFFSLVFGLSRFSFFTMSQFINGGALEGLAIIFFLLYLLYTVRALLSDDYPQKYKGLLWSVLFANLCLYTHERYIILLPFTILIVLLYPGIKKIGRNRRVLIGLISFFSIVLNVVMKKYVYGIPFLMGTGGAKISFSFSSAFSFFIDAILNMFQINAGPQYLVGEPFSSLSPGIMILISVFAGLILLILMVYLFKSVKAMVKPKTLTDAAIKQIPDATRASIFIFMFVLLFACLAPVVVTIRLEQRFLQSSFIVFILILVIALSGMKFNNNSFRTVVFSLIIMFFLWVNYNYLDKGVDSLYLKDAEKVASIFKQAVSTGVIFPNTTKLYILEKNTDLNNDNAINWALLDGCFFELYQNKCKEIAFIDSSHTIRNFNKDNMQIVYIKDKAVDVTQQYLTDSLRHFQY